MRAFSVIGQEPSSTAFSQTTHTFFFKVWIITFFVKLIIGVWLPLFNDEAYYWVWSHHLQLSYFDHPPMIAWLLKLGHVAENFGSAVRFPIILIGHSTVLVWYYILRRFLSGRQLIFWFWVTILSPLVGWGSIIATPDVPVLFFYSVALLALVKILNLEPNANSTDGRQCPRWKWYAVLGSALGLGFCSKYHIVLFVLIATVMLLITGKWRLIKLKGFSLMAVLALLCSAPVFIWNWQNGFSSFYFQLDHGLGKASFNVIWPLRYVIEQILLVFPLLFFLAFKVMKMNNTKWLVPFAWGPLLFFLVTSFRGRVEANWPLLAYPGMYALAVQSVQAQKWIRVTLGFWAVSLVLLLLEIVRPFIPGVYDHTKLREWTQFDPLLTAVREHQPFFATSYQMAASLSFASKTQVYKLPGVSRRDFYDEVKALGKKPPREKHFFVGARGQDRIYRWAEDNGYLVYREIPIEGKLILYEIGMPP